MIELPHAPDAERSNCTNANAVVIPNAVWCDETPLLL